jgi:hypothetical protein
MFESVVQRCIAEGLGADGFAVDASLIAADANKQRSFPSREWKPEEIIGNRDPSRAGVPCHSRRRGVRRSLASDAEVHFPI